MIHIEYAVIGAVLTAAFQWLSGKNRKLSERVEELEKLLHSNKPHLYSDERGSVEDRLSRLESATGEDVRSDAKHDTGRPLDLVSRVELIEEWKQEGYKEELSWIRESIRDVKRER
jgi:hypothetical protein